MIRCGLRGTFLSKSTEVEAVIMLIISTETALNYISCYRLVFFVFSYFSFQFATTFLSAVCWGRQALWLVLVVSWLFVRPDNVLDFAWGFHLPFYIISLVYLHSRNHI